MLLALLILQHPDLERNHTTGFPGLSACRQQSSSGTSQHPSCEPVPPKKNLFLAIYMYRMIFFLWLILIEMLFYFKLEDSCFTILCYFSSFIKPSFKKLSVVKGKGRPFSLWSWTTHIRQRLLVFDLKEFKWAPHDLWSHLSPFLSHIYFDHHWAHFFTHQFCCHNRQAGVSF